MYAYAAWLRTITHEPSDTDENYKGMTTCDGMWVWAKLFPIQYLCIIWKAYTRIVGSYKLRSSGYLWLRRLFLSVMKMLYVWRELYNRFFTA